MSDCHCDSSGPTHHDEPHPILTAPFCSAGGTTAIGVDFARFVEHVSVSRDPGVSDLARVACSFSPEDRSAFRVQANHLSGSSLVAGTAPFQFLLVGKELCHCPGEPRGHSERTLLLSKRTLYLP